MPDHRPEIDLPDSLQGMDDLALDMRLISSHRADHVWHHVNPELWAASRNPWAVLKSIGRPELEELGTRRDRTGRGDTCSFTPPPGRTMRPNGSR